MRPISSFNLGIIVGSYATYYWYKNSRKPKDIDIYVLPDAMLYFQGCKVSHGMYHTSYDGFSVDITVATENNGLFPIISAHTCSPIIHINKCPLAIAKPSILLLIKVIHSQYGAKRRKNIHDRQFLERMTHYSTDEEQLFEVRKKWLMRVTNEAAKQEKRQTLE